MPTVMQSKYALIMCLSISLTFQTIQAMDSTQLTDQTERVAAALTAFNISGIQATVNPFGHINYVAYSSNGGIIHANCYGEIYQACAEPDNRALMGAAGTVYKLLALKYKEEQQRVKSNNAHELMHIKE